MKRSDDSLRCSFCHKTEGDVGKLITSPSDYPRAYICDECITVCATILEDDNAESTPPEPHEQVLNAVAAWIHQESTGGDAGEHLDRLRGLARHWIETS